MLRLSSAERTPSDSGFRLQELLDLRLREHLALRDDLAVHEKRRRSHDARLGYRYRVGDVLHAHRAARLRCGGLRVIVELVAALASRSQHGQHDCIRQV